MHLKKYLSLECTFKSREAYTLYVHETVRMYSRTPAKRNPSERIG